MGGKIESVKVRIFHFVSVLWILRYNDAHLFIFISVFKIINETIQSRLEPGKETGF